MILGRKSVAAAALAVLLSGAQAQPVELEGVKFEPTVQVSDTTLQLNGVGLRTRAIFKVYVAALYLPQKANTAQAALQQTGPRRVVLTMLRNVDADSFVGALNDGLKNNQTEEQLNALRPQIDALNALLKGVGEARKGDRILFEFAGDATRVLVNGQARGNPIPGEAFFGAVLRIWLGDKPVDAGLKKGLLGG